MTGWLRRARPPASVWPQPDFLPRRPGISVLAWVLAAAGLLVAAVAVWDGIELARQQADAQARLLRWQAEQRRWQAAAQPPPTAVATAAAAGRGGATETRRLRAWQLAALLHHPWAEVFDATEQAAAADVQWQQLSHDAESGDLRLEGVAAQRQAALRIVDELSQRPGWDEVVLVRLEAGDASLPGPMRFEVRARYRGSRIAAQADAAAGTTP